MRRLIFVFLFLLYIPAYADIFGPIDQLQDLLDVVITSPSDNDNLSYDTATGKWTNQTVTNGVYTNAANSMSLINPLTTLAESWIGPSSTTGIYFKGGNIGIGTTSPTAKLHIYGTTITDLPTYSAEFLDANDWTSTGWTGDWATGWTHTVGNTSVLSQIHAAVNATKYQIAYTVTNRTAGSFTVAFGGQSNSGITATGAFGPTTTSTANLTITPTTDFDGTIVISIKSITAVSSPVATYASSDGTARMEIRANTGSNNSFLGVDAGRFNTTGSNLTAVGVNAGRSNTTGYSLTAVGVNAGYSNTTGNSLTFVGVDAGRSNTTGNSLTVVGVNAGYSNTTGSNLTFVGVSAGRYQADGTTTLTDSENSVYIGYGTRGFSNADDNSIVIGYNAIGIGANTVVLGNDSITTTALKGNVGIGTTVPVAKLEVQSSGTVGFPVTSGTAQGTGLRMRLSTPATSNSAILDMGSAGSGGAWIQSTNVGNLALNYPLLLNPNGGNIGIGTTTPAVSLEIAKDSANTATVQEMARLTATSTGTVAANFGASINTYLEDASGNTAQIASSIGTIWTTATHASESSAITFSGVTAGGALTEIFKIIGNGSVVLPVTITAVGTTGNQTINKAAGRVNIAAAGTSVTVTNSLVTANSIVIATAATNDTTARVTSVVPSAGSFIIYTVAVTAETAFNFLVIS